VIRASRPPRAPTLFRKAEGHTLSRPAKNQAPKPGLPWRRTRPRLDTLRRRHRRPAEMLGARCPNQHLLERSTHSRKARR
jgi:hypothetical protein